MIPYIIGLICVIAFFTIVGLYYRLWVDCILNIKEKDDTNWKTKSIISMNLAMVFNFVFFMVIIQKYILGYFFYEVSFPFLSKYWENVASFIILFIMPCLLINYFLIFYKKRYEIILKKYPYNKGKLIVSYILISVFVPIALVLISLLYT